MSHHRAAPCEGFRQLTCIAGDATACVFAPTNEKFMNQMRSISDDDLCSDCRSCSYDPGALSMCCMGWPGTVASPSHPRAGYIISCDQFKQIRKPQENWVPRAQQG